MFVRTRTLRAVQEENERLAQALEQAKKFLAHYKAQEGDVAAALVNAQVEARRQREEAAQEAHRIVEEAASRANALKAGAVAEVTAAGRELERLRTARQEIAESIRHVLQELAAVPELASAPPMPGREIRPRESTNDAQPAAAGHSLFIDPSASRGSAVPPLQSAPPTMGGWARGTAPALADEPPPATHPAAEPVDAEPSSLQRLALPLAAAAVVLAMVAAGLVTWLRPDLTRRAESEASAPDRDAATARKDLLSGGAAGAKRPAGRPLAVRVQTRRAVWVRADVDGRRTVNRLVAANQSLDLAAADVISLRVGDAGAVSVSVNGAAPVALGRDGAVLTRRFAVPRARPETPAMAAARLTTPQPLAAPGAPSGRASAAPVLAAVAPGEAPRPSEPTVASDVALVPDVATLAAAPLSAPASLDVSSPAAADEQAAASPSVEADVLASHREYLGALMARDTATVQRLAADGFSATVPFLDRTSQQLPLRVERESVEVRGVGAVVSGSVLETILGPDGRPAGEATWLFWEVWINRDGRWRLLNVRFAKPPGQ